MTAAPPPPGDTSGTWGAPTAGGDPAYQAPGYPMSPPPGYPGGDSMTAVAPKPPGTVTGAFVLYLISAIAIIVTGLLVFTGPVERRLREELEVTDTSNTTMSLDQLVQVTQWVAFVISLIIGAVWLLFIFKMRAGRNWARIVITVFAVLGLLSLFSGYRSGQAWDFIGPVLSVLALVLMWLPASNEYFQAAGRHRAAQVMARG
ncbi:DUF4064 domain-containing protein [Nakamurella leprariae]|uniref:DUF4064 domain-containing protein n=1 Tax=Nakamurella leprariae TaxID=2803911 RepID=A0A939BV88_9ACTN|nr:DUF4064 domain-containing protein [Nakamurella leprariae]MBM9466283.1 DUF4064 domain-containing protein [Nakamurella leprariae]